MRAASSPSSTGASTERSRAPRRCSISMTSDSLTSSRSASSFGSGGEALGLEPVLLLLQVEEELALRLRRADLHHPPVVHHVADDVGADPPDGVRREADAAVGIELLHRLHEADVALLDQVEQVAEGALVLARDHHHQPQVGGDQTVRRLDVLVLLVADRQIGAPRRATAAGTCGSRRGSAAADRSGRARGVGRGSGSPSTSVASLGRARLGFDSVGHNAACRPRPLSASESGSPAAVVRRSRSARHRRPPAMRP